MLIDRIPWPSAPARLSLADREVHVWAAPLDVPPDALAKLEKTLQPIESERARKFRYDRHRNRFIAGRGFLRGILGRYLQIQPGRLEFAYSPLGKPTLASGFAGAGLDFNLAHSADLALAAVSRAGTVGIDVEHVRSVKDADDLVRRFFSPRENAAFRKLPAADKPAAFFNLWTRKEALLKATGEGISRSLNLVEVSFLPGEPARLLSVSGDKDEAARWHLRELAPADGYVGAMAVRALNIAVRCWKWS